MKPQNQYVQFIYVLLISIVLSGCTTTAIGPTEQPKIITADNPAIFYQGRIPLNIHNEPVFVWQGSALQTQFTGTSLAFEFGETHDQVFFNATVDDENYVIQAKPGWVEFPGTLTNREHTLTLFKRSEASKGHVVFKGLRVDSLATITPTPRTNKPRYIFYGDSITVGACNEDGDTDQWQDYSTHNNALSYGALTASLMNADYRNIAVSGVGISIGYYPHNIDTLWNRYYPTPNAPVATPGEWQPDIVFLNYGENDDSYSKSHNLEFPIDYAEKYTALVLEMRKVYPKSKIIILRGGMYGGARSEKLATPWKNLVATLEKNDSNIYHYVFHHWFPLHPRVNDHEIMAQELVTFLEGKNW